MKQLVNFRLSPQAVYTLLMLEKKLHTTKTAVVEVALQAYAKQNLAVKNPLLAFAGALDADVAKKMLHDIKTNRRNKSKDISL